MIKDYLEPNNIMRSYNTSHALTTEAAEIDQMFGIMEETGQLLKSKFIKENQQMFEIKPHRRDPIETFGGVRVLVTQQEKKRNLFKNIPLANSATQSGQFSIIPVKEQQN